MGRILSGAGVASVPGGDIMYTASGQMTALNWVLTVATVVFILFILLGLFAESIPVVRGLFSVGILVRWALASAAVSAVSYWGAVHWWGSWTGPSSLIWLLPCSIAAGFGVLGMVWSALARISGAVDRRRKRAAHAAARAALIKAWEADGLHAEESGASRVGWSDWLDARGMSQYLF